MIKARPLASVWAMMLFVVVVVVVPLAGSKDCNHARLELKLLPVLVK